MASPTSPGQTALALFGPSCEPLPNVAECEAELGVPLLEPSDLPIGSEVADPDVEDPEGLAGALAEGGDWLEPDPGSWGGATSESEQAMVVEQGSAADITEVAPAEGVGPGDVGGHAYRQATDRAKGELALACKMIRHNLPFLESEGIWVETDGMEKFMAYGAALEEEAKEGDGKKKSRARGEGGLAAGMINFVPIDVEKKSQ
ncbi:hypothetical protein BDK51DRAFT_26414 [Blyttiomyces helicus]|uniref:Uncharacterized protein n=1 Tax=Blyttiomyces helicus TaxID=388810 RepID=A0A4P9WPL0_9FUNG|nr:hypothetical protein BDK51DRAFT_26414 [Blyttiomyces helicus]|eukprot:RKO93190.1 hypothetical protein BDK51DRAFT_26414 [Blyttiomyces helicus]